MVSFIILLVVSSMFTLMGIYLRKRIRKFQLEGKKTTANIVEYIKKKSKDSDGGYTTYYYPNLSFKTYDGKRIRKILDSGTTWKPKKALPHRIEIYYIKEDGEYEVLINSRLWVSIIPNSVLFFGILFLLSVISVYILTEILHYDLSKILSDLLNKK